MEKKMSTAKKTMSILLLLAIFFLTACGSANNNEAKESTLHTEGEKKITEGENAPDASQPYEDDFEESLCYITIKNTLEEAFSFLSPDISYDKENRMIHILVTAPEGTANAMIINKEAIEKDWTDFCDSLNGVSKTAYEACLSEGYKVACTIMVLSDANQEQTLFASMNGEAFYNCFDES